MVLISYATASPDLLY